MFNILSYGFILRGIEVGIIIGAIAPLIGIFLVLRRYSLIADTLSHVSLAGVAIGLLLNINPLITAVIASVLSSIAIERLRISKRIFGESALSIFLSGSLALAIVLIILAAFAVALAIPIVGVLLIAALIVIPVVTALQFGKSFKKTILIAEAISLGSVIFGIILSFYLNLSTGGTIVLIAIGIFLSS